VQLLLESGAVQAKLHVSQPGDADEVEADRVAEQVVSTSSVPTLHRKCSCPGGGTTCPECDPEEMKGIHRKAASPTQSDKTVAGDFVASLGPGQPLDRSVRSMMEARFGRDFSQVRVHADGEAANAASAVRARAYTIGHDIVFGSGEYAPATVEGKRLLAHELTHAVQQQRAPASPSAPQRVTSPDDAPEQEAHVGAATALAGKRPDIRHLPGAAIARDTPPGHQAARKVPLIDEGSGKQSTISEDDSEFQRNYVDNNIHHVQYWSTPYADQDAKLRQFTVVYADGRTAQFSVDDIPVRYEINRTPGRREARIAFKPSSYTRKKNGLIYPDIIGFGSTPRLIDIATTIQENHRRRKQFLEVAELTFKFTIILTAYVTPPETPGRNLRRPTIRTRVPEVEAPPAVEKPIEPPPERVRPRGPGNQEASAEAAAAREAKRAPETPLPKDQVVIRDKLLAEHPNLSPAVATDAARGGERALGKNVEGGDVVLLKGGQREVSAFGGKFTPENVGSRLAEEAAQRGTTEVYFQINSPGATREGFLGMVSFLRRIPGLAGKFIKVFSSSGEVWWSGRIAGG